jgi:hypothetical protein
VDPLCGHLAVNEVAEWPPVAQHMPSGLPARSRSGAGRRSPCRSAASDERWGARRARLRPRYRDGPCRHPRASRAQCPRSSNRRTVALARSATVASDREKRASSAALIRGRPGCGQPQPSWRSSVGHLADTSPERGRGGDVALPSPRRLLAAGIGRRARRRRAVPAWVMMGIAVWHFTVSGVNRFVAARGASATQAAG